MSWQNLFVPSEAAHQTTVFSLVVMIIVRISAISQIKKQKQIVYALDYMLTRSINSSLYTLKMEYIIGANSFYEHKSMSYSTSVCIMFLCSSLYQMPYLQFSDSHDTTEMAKFMRQRATGRLHGHKGSVMVNVKGSIGDWITYSMGCGLLSG